MTTQDVQLDKKLGPLMLWGLGVGYVIAGLFFGWNLGLEKGGSLGLAIATLLIIIMYSCFVLTYCELSCLFPKAGGAFVYAEQAFGPKVSLIAGMMQYIEFIFGNITFFSIFLKFFSLII